MTSPYAPPRATWAWLVPSAPGDHALSVAVEPEPLAAELSTHFRLVTHTATAPFGGDRDRFSCVAVAGSVAERAAASGMGLPGFFLECHRVLCAGGWLCAMDLNRWWAGNLIGRSGSATGRVPFDIAACVRRAGFSAVRRYYLHPSLDEPRCIIPATRRAVLTNEVYFGLRGTGGMVRRAIAACGAHPLLYKSLMVLAQA